MHPLRGRPGKPSAETLGPLMSLPTSLAQTPEPPYFAVIFTSQRTAGDRGYAGMADRMVELARTMPGYLGMESVRDPAGVGITVSYWRTEEDIRNWKQNAEHLRAQAAGKSTWYSEYTVRIAKVERAYGKVETDEPHEHPLPPPAGTPFSPLSGAAGR
jgi:heme-degrading monooxygenase HmoA